MRESICDGVQESETLGVVKVRILTAKCVREAIAAARSDLEQLERQSQAQVAGVSRQELHGTGAGRNAVDELDDAR